MPELRWALIGLGALFIVGLALWEWRRARRRRAQLLGVSGTGVAIHAGGEEWPRRADARIEPRFDEPGETGPAAREPVDVLLEGVPVIHPSSAAAQPSAAVDLRVSGESAVDVPGRHAQFPPAADRADDTEAVSGSPSASAPAIRWPPERADRVLTLRLVNPQGALLSGRAVRLAVEQAGLVHGPQSIYHRVDDQGAVLVSVANMLRPGDLDPSAMDEQQFRGLSLFSVLPGALPAERMLEELVAVARAIAWRVNAVVQDDHGAELDSEKLAQLKQSLPDAAQAASP